MTAIINFEEQLPKLRTFACERADGSLFLSFTNWNAYFGRRFSMPRKEALQLGFELRDNGVLKHVPAHGWLIPSEARK